MPSKKKYPRISVITPSFNQGNYLETTIKSVVNQGYPNLEYLIMDGGSTDNSVKIIKKYAKKFPNTLFWVSKKDGGQVDAINKGLKKAKGDIVAYLNSDDYYHPNTFEIVAEYFMKYPETLWLIGNCDVTDKKLEWIFRLKHLWPIHKSRNALEIFNTINQPSTFLTKKLIDQVGIFNENYDFAFDYDYWMRCSEIKLPARITNKLATFRIHQNSKGNSSFVQQFKEDLLIAKKASYNKFNILIHGLLTTITLFSYKYLKA